MAEVEQGSSSNRSNMKRYTGGCLCGAVRFEAELDLSEPVSRCNCSICTKLGSTNAYTKPSGFRVTAAEEHLGEHRLGASPNYRAFCKRCGIYCFAGGDVEELGGEFRSINIHCLDDIDPAEYQVVYWDGRHDNWAAGTRDRPWPIKR
ncbi:GFA family protein [Myxococcus sp. Y35]|uniref:GFA family protein n=1 Tax=Pseudomyxococcus flavus TaxID=3115648 RepID=UPI003CF8E43B